MVSWTETDLNTGYNYSGSDQSTDYMKIDREKTEMWAFNIANFNKIFFFLEYSEQWPLSFHVLKYIDISKKKIYVKVSVVSKGYYFFFRVIIISEDRAGVTPPWNTKANIRRKNQMQLNKVDIPNVTIYKIGWYFYK